MKRDASSVSISFLLMAVLMLVQNVERTVSFTPTLMSKRSRHFVMSPLLQSASDKNGAEALQVSPGDINVQRFVDMEEFDRWKFMKDLLDEEVSSTDVNELMYLMLSGYMDRTEDDNDEAEQTGSPVVDDELRAKLRTVIGMSEGDESDSAVPGLVGTDLIVHDAETLDLMESLLPDPEEDEDGYTSMWDIIKELHGREMVKISERNGTIEWKSVCVIARMLAYYDFLTEGMPKSIVAKAEQS
uniref:RxLR effector protein n=1 Tax=Craspedostauros australis TaxID=1486917 RepID=A0A7R9WUK1_9STRA